MTKIGLAAIFALLIGTNTFAQDKAPLHLLQPGEKMPNVTMDTILNYPGGRANITDFKGKLLILVYWNVYCLSCIEEMPQMEELQRKLGDRVQVLYYTRDSKKKVDDLARKSNFFREIHLPTVVSDTVLTKLFPTQTLGLHSWVNQKGILQQMLQGGSYSVNDVNSFLNGKDISFLKKNARQDQGDFNLDVPLWLEGNGRQVKYIQYHSYIAGNLPGNGGSGGHGITDSTTKKMVGYFCWNTIIAQLYNIAFSESGKNQWAKTIWEVQDSSKYIEPRGTDLYAWWRANSYCYEVKVPVDKSAQVYTYMQQDLERYFGLQGNIEKRKFHCWVLVRIPQSEALLHKNTDKYPNLTIEGELYKKLKEDSIVVHNAAPFVILMGLKKYRPTNVTLLDETNYKGHIDLNIKASYDLQELKKELQKNGLDLVEADRELSCLVLREKEYEPKIIATSK